MDHQLHTGHSQQNQGTGPHMNHNGPPKKTQEASAHQGHLGHGAALQDPNSAKAMEKDMAKRFWVSLLLTIPIVLYSPMFAMLTGLHLPTPVDPNWVMLLLTTPVVFWSGNIFLVGAYQALKNKTLDMSVLIATGVAVSYIFSVLITFFIGGESFYEAAAMLVTFVLFGHWMEMKARRGTSDALRSLFDLVPPMARVIRDGQEILVATAEIGRGDTVLLKPGDKVPVDGVVSEGETSIDESLITGESIPVYKKAGDAVIGGSINQSGAVRYTATKVGEDTALAQIIKLVERAQNSKAPGQRLADRAAQYLVILAVGSGLLTFLAWYFWAGEALVVSLTFAISAVVIACPDALGLATPTAVAVGTGIGAKHNILIKDAATLEGVSKVSAIILDKTGTLTEGKPTITDLIPANGFNRDEVLGIIAAAEATSNHPLSRAVMEEAEARQVAIPGPVSGFQALAGHGVQARVKAMEVLVGTSKLMADHGVDFTALQEEANTLLDQGKTLMMLAVDGKAAGVVAAADPIKATSYEAVKKFNDLGIQVAMLTGDNRKTAEAVGQELGIQLIFAEALPQDKASYVAKLQQEGKYVAMVGDGINDAPALAQADIGIAIGAGTDVAVETADVVLMKSDPLDILAAIRLSKATVNKMKQNLFWASIYNILAIPLAGGLFYNSLGWSLRPEISALLMSASSIIVATNAVMLKTVESKLKS